MTDILIRLALALAICGAIVLLLYGVMLFWRGIWQDYAEDTEQEWMCPPCNQVCNQGRTCPRRRKT